MQRRRIVAHLVADSASRLDNGSSNRNAFRLLDDRATDGDALALAARQLRRHSLKQAVRLQENFGGARNPRCDLRLANSLANRPKLKFLAYVWYRGRAHKTGTPWPCLAPPG